MSRAGVYIDYSLAPLLHVPYDSLQPAAPPAALRQERDSVDSAAQNHLEHEVAELQRGLAEVDTRLKQMGKALVELARVGQETVERGPAARQVDQTALRDWVAQELTKLRGQGKVRQPTCPGSNAPPPPPHRGALSHV